MKHEIKSNRVLMSSFVLCLALVSSNLLAQESSIEGTSTTTDDTISSSAPDQLLSVTLTLPPDTGGWDCMVTGSADAINPLNGVDNRYIFGVSEGSVLPAATKSGADRTIDFDDLNLSEQTDRVAVSTTYVFNELPTDSNKNVHTFYWSARKGSGANANMVVDDSSMSVVCSQF